MSTRTRVVTAVTAVALGGTGLAACSQVKQIEPKVAFAKAYMQTTGQKDMSMTMSLRTTKADITKLVDAVRTADPSATSDPTTDQAIGIVSDLLPKLKFTSKAHSNGKNLGEETDPAKLDQAVSLTVDGSGMDVVSVGGDAFVKVDVAGLGQKTGLFTANQVKLLTASAPPELSWVNDVVDGKWVGIPASATKDLLDAQKSGGINDPAQQKKLRDAVQKSMERNASITRSGSKDGADEMTVTVKVKPFVQDLQSAMKDAGATNTVSPSDLKGLKDDATMTMTTLIKDDRLTHAEMALPQVFGWFDETTMDEQGKKALAAMKSSGFQGTVVTDYDTTAGQVTKPTGARMLTQQEVDSIVQSMSPSAVPSGT